MGPSTFLDAVPDEILVRILVLAARDATAAEPSALLEDLCKLKTVCSRFDRVAYQAESVTCRLDKAKVTDMNALRFLQSTHRLNSLRLTSPKSLMKYPIPDTMFLAISGACANLEHFETYGCSLSWEGMTPELLRTLSLCPRLKTLKLTESYAQLSEPLSGRHRFQSLVELSLTQALLEDACLASIIKQCPCLDVLNLDRVSGLSSPTVKSDTLRRVVLKVDPFANALGFARIEARRLLHLEVTAVDEVSVNAPMLSKLVLLNVGNVVPEGPWKIAMLDVENWFGTYEQLLFVLGTCGNATHVRLGPTSVYWCDSKLSHVLKPFAQLRVLELPYDMPHLTFHEEDIASFHVALAQLKKLAVGFERQDKSLEFFLELLSTAPRLESIQIDLSHVVCGRKVDTIVRMLLDLQKRFPSLDIIVKWPNDCTIGVYLFGSN